MVKETGLVRVVNRLGDSVPRQCFVLSGPRCRLEPALAIGALELRKNDDLIGLLVAEETLLEPLLPLCGRSTRGPGLLTRAKNRGGSELGDKICASNGTVVLLHVLQNYFLTDVVLFAAYASLAQFTWSTSGFRFILCNQSSKNTCTKQ